MAVNVNNDRAVDGDAPAEPKLNYFQKVWQYRKYLIVEPFIFFYVMASVFNSVAMLNFPIDKACRVNFGYNKIVCDTILDKSVLGIECDDLSFTNTTQGATPEMFNITIDSVNFNYTVCKAEVESQILNADISGKRAPIAAVFPLIVLIFAGGWSDRYNKRKVCMIVPVVGEMLSFTCLMISAIFFDLIPMEFGAYCEAIVPALFGGLTFALMAVYSYITIATPEEDRVFRFGIFAMFVTAVPFIGQPISGVLFKYLGYIYSFMMALVFQIIAITYIIVFIDEVKPEPKSKIEEAPAVTELPPSMEGINNLAYEDAQTESQGNNKIVSFELKPQQDIPPKHEPPKEDVVPVKHSFLRVIFDEALSLIMDCVKFPFIKRENNGRMLLVLLLLAYFLTLGPTQGENDYWYRYTLKKLNWNGNDFTIYSTFSSAAALVGTFIGTAILSKLLKFSDSMIGILSAMFIVVSRVLFAFSKDTTSFYIAGGVEMFVTLRVIAIKSIGSSIVEGEELSKMYSIFGISEPIGQFIFAPIYSEIYKSTVETFPGTIFLFSDIFFGLNVVVFILCYIILRRNKSKAAAEEKSKEMETTHL